VGWRGREERRERVRGERGRWERKERSEERRLSSLE
jgi:hypothetical protein